jgi:TetR/AcrR family tetracycline transcriptional repressor
MSPSPRADRSATRDGRDAGRAARRGGPATPLTRERIVGTALAIVDAEGLGALSMRRLGSELGVDPMAVYYHVPNKEALLDAIVEAVMSAIDLGRDDRAASPEDRVMWAASAYRDAMLAHVNALPIVLTRGPNTPAAMRPVEVLMGILRDGGLSAEQALAGMNAIAAAVRGIAAMAANGGSEPPPPEQLQAMAAQFPVEEFPNLHEAMMCPTDFFERDFEFGIRALARGLLGSV